MTLIIRTKKELGSECPKLKLGRQLGQGGNGCVYAAKHPSHGNVAIKFFLNGETKRRIRFEDEIKVVTERLENSPRVLPILEFSIPAPSSTGVPWYVMPAAEPIRTAMPSTDWRAMLPAFIELADGLAELHQLGVAHRDVKPENLFRYADRYRYGDFGIAAFPERQRVTRLDEPMGPATYMAPEMEKDANAANAFLADVYSLAKSIWALLVREKFAFPGQYSPIGKESLSLREDATGLFLEPLESLLEDATSSRPEVRPSAVQFSARLRDVANLLYDFAKATPLEWEFANTAALRGRGVARAEWTTPEDIARIFRLLSQHKGMNHFFYPEGGGSHVSGASLHEGGRLLKLHIDDGGADYLVKPLKLILERFPSHPELGYAVLEVGDVERLTDGTEFLDGPAERLRWVNDYDYVVNDSDAEEPRYRGIGRTCERRFRAGLCVLAPTSGIYNQIDDYMGTAQRLGVASLRREFEALIAHADGKNAAPRKLIPVARLLQEPVTRVPFQLDHLTLELFWRLFDLDNAMRDQRNATEAGGIVSAAEVFDRIRSTAIDPIKEQALDLLRGLTGAQCGEYLALVDVAKRIALPEEFSERATMHSRVHHEEHYLCEKLGNGYMKKALDWFGLQVLGASPGRNHAS